MKKNDMLSDEWFDGLTFPDEDVAAWTDEAKAGDFDRMVRRRRLYVIGRRVAAVAAVLAVAVTGVWLCVPRTADPTEAPAVTAQTSVGETPVPPSLMVEVTVPEPAPKPVKVERKQKSKRQARSEYPEPPSEPETAESMQLPTPEYMLADLPPAAQQHIELYEAEMEQQKETHRRQKADKVARQQREIELVLTLLAKEPAKVPAGTVIVQNS